MSLDQIGLILNLIGTILAIFSITEYKGGWTINEKTKKNEYLALFKYPKLLKIGVGIILIGFAFSFVGTLQ